MKTLVAHDSTNVFTPVGDGVLRWKVSTAEVATATGLTTWTLMTPPVDVVLVDAWVDIVTPFGLSNLRVSLGDADGDDSFLLPVQVGSASAAGRIALTAAEKGQKLGDHRTGLVKTALTATIDTGGTASAGEFHIFAKFVEISVPDHALAGFTTTAGTPAGYIGTAAGAASGAWNISPNGSTTDPIAAGETLTITGDGSTASTAYNSDTNTMTVSAAAQSWTVTDGSASEAIANGDTLKITGAGATSTAYDSATNTLTVTSSSAGTTTWTATDGTVTSGVADGDTLKITGGGTTTSAFDSATKTFTISSTAAPLQGITATDGLALTGSSTNPQVEIDDIGATNLVLARDDGTSLAASLAKTDQIMVNLATGAPQSDQLHRFSLQAAVEKVTFIEPASSNSFSFDRGHWGATSNYITYFLAPTSSAGHRGTAAQLGHTACQNFEGSGVGTALANDIVLNAHWHIPISDKVMDLAAADLTSVWVGATDSGIGGSAINTLLTFDLSLYADATAAVLLAEKTGQSLTLTSTSPPLLQKVTLATSDLTSAGVAWAGPTGEPSLLVVVNFRMVASGTSPFGSGDIIHLDEHAIAWPTRTLG